MNMQIYIQNLKAPIDLAEYMKNPIYGPVAFCNPRHEGVAALLNDLYAYNDTPIKKMPRRTPKQWHLFSELCQQSETLQKIRWNEQQSELRYRKKLLRKQIKQQKTT